MDVVTCTLLSCVVAIGAFVDVLQTVIVHASCRRSVGRS